MNEHKKKFIALAIRSKALLFGTFILKSGRKSPYFFNAGCFHDSKALLALGQLYAHTLLERNMRCASLFGPAYKGIPLATATSIALETMGKSVALTFNRKEAKDHGEGGQLIGAALGEDIVVIDDVVSAGTAFRECENIIHSQGGKISGLLVAFDRCEYGLTKHSALHEIEETGVQVECIVTIYDVIDYLQLSDRKAEVTAIKEYLSTYGAAQ